MGLPESPDDPRTDEQLLRAIDKGEALAFDALYYRYRDWVVKLAARLTGNPDDALDVMQETFIYLLGKFPGLKLTGRLTTLLYPAVKNLSITAVRKRQRQESRTGGDSLEGTIAPISADPGSLRSELASALGAIGESHREVMLMRFVDDMTIIEIAAALEIPEGTVKSRLHHAIAMLRDDPRARRYFL
jgi:RNA polymerase sigma-70 factor (ECF subfamily)